MQTKPCNYQPDSEGNELFSDTQLAVNDIRRKKWKTAYARQWEKLDAISPVSPNWENSELSYLTEKN